MLTAAYYILRRGVPYRELGHGYFDALDRTKLTRRLIRRLQALGVHVEVKSAA
jgi:transposase